MKHVFILLAIGMSINLSAQNYKTHIISLAPHVLSIDERAFYIETVMDKRQDRRDIGEVRIGILNSPRVAVFERGLAASLNAYYSLSLPMQDGQESIIAHIREFELSEELKTNTERAQFNLVIDYYSGAVKLYTSRQETYFEGEEVKSAYSTIIDEALHKSLLEFAAADWNRTEEYVNPRGDTANGNANEDAADGAYTPEVIPNQVSQDVLAIGYQIGGFTLIGLDYEARLSKVLGVHVGAGLAGYTVGFKLHTAPGKNSSFINLSVKDGGWGLIQTTGAEYGGRIPFSPHKELGFHWQVGIHGILAIDPVFEQTLFDSNGEVKSLLTVGIGLSW